MRTVYLSATFALLLSYASDREADATPFDKPPTLEELTLDRFLVTKNR